MSSFVTNFEYEIDLYRDANKSFVLQAEYFQLNKRYSIGNYPMELPICVVAAGRNLVKTDRYLRFLESIDHQNYSNYRLFITDDASTDGSYDILK